jgi:hypothetical protein
MMIAILSASICSFIYLLFVDYTILICVACLSLYPDGFELCENQHSEGRAFHNSLAAKNTRAHTQYSVMVKMPHIICLCIPSAAPVYIPVISRSLQAFNSDTTGLRV